MSLLYPFDCQVNCCKSGTDESETDRVSKTLKKIEHILCWQPLTCYPTTAETHSQVTWQPTFLGTPEDFSRDVVSGRRIASSSDYGREDDLVTVYNINDMPVDNGDENHANQGRFNEQKYSKFTPNIHKNECIERENNRRNTEDVRCGCGTSPVPKSLIQPFEERKFQETSRLPTSPSIGYYSDIGQVKCHGNFTDNSDATRCLETNVLETCSSESVHCCRIHALIGKTSLAECCDKHRRNKIAISSYVDRQSSRDVSLSRKSHLAQEVLQSHPRASTDPKSDMSRGGNRKSSGGRVVSIALPDAARSSEETEAKKTMENLRNSSAPQRNSPSEDMRRSSPTDCHSSPGLANTTTSNIESKEENPVQRESRGKSITWNRESERRNTPCSEGQSFVPQDELYSSLNEQRREDRRPTSSKPSEAASDVPEQIFGTTAVHDRTARESLSDADRAKSRRSRDNHGTYGERKQSLAVRSSTSPPGHSESVKDNRRSNISERQTQRHRVPDKSDENVFNDNDGLTIAPSKKSSSTALTPRDDVRQNPDSEEFVTMLQNQATMICAVEAENRFLKIELMSVRRTLGSLVEENSGLHERLKHRLAEELLRTSEDTDRTQDIHRQGSVFVLSLASSPQANENNAALCRLLKKYDFQKVKQEFETIIRLHRMKSERMEAQLKFSRSEISRLEAEVTDLQRRLGCEESFLLIRKSTTNFAVGLCVRCCSRPATILSTTDAYDNSHIKQLIKERDELIERVLSTKSVCSLAMDREAELYAQFSSFITNFERAQLEVFEALRQREELKDELNRVAESTKSELRQEKLCWKKQMEVEQAESEERNMELIRKVEELLSEVEVQRLKLNKSQREKEMLLKKCELSNCRIGRIETDYNKELEELNKSLCKMTQERDDARNLVRMSEHQRVTARTSNDQGHREPETVNGVLEQFNTLESHLNSKVDQLQEYYGKALRDRDDIIQQQMTIIQKLKKKCCKIKRRLRHSRQQKKAVKRESRELPVEPKTDEKDKPNTVQNPPSSDLKTDHL